MSGRWEILGNGCTTSPRQNKQAKTGAAISVQEWRRARGMAGMLRRRGELQREEERDFMIQGKPLGIADLDIHVVAHPIDINNAK